jgi:hypothetical protein
MGNAGAGGLDDSGAGEDGFLAFCFGIRAVIEDQVTA